MIKEKTNEHSFQFMLKEYEMLYSKFEMHYAAVEKTISFYFLIIGAVVSANSFFINNYENFSIFDLSGFQLICSFFIFIMGSINLLKIIEHRLLIITYVKNLNQNRKWFSINSFDKNELDRYSLFKTSYKSPKYYKKYRHFYWEVLGIAIINSIFISLILVNLFKKMNWESSYADLMNFIGFIIFMFISVYIFMFSYKNRGTSLEKDLTTRGLEE